MDTGWIAGTMRLPETERKHGAHSWMRNVMAEATAISPQLI